MGKLRFQLAETLGAKLTCLGKRNVPKLIFFLTQFDTMNLKTDDKSLKQHC